VSQEALLRVFDHQGFDGTPLEIDLAALHVPYADSGLQDIEELVHGASRRRERVGLSGPIGSGKTSVLRYALDHPENALAPIWVSVARDSEDVVCEPKRFVAHLIQGMLRAAEKAGALNADQVQEVLVAATERRPLPTKSRKLAGKIAAKFWVTSAELAGEVTTTLAGQDLDRPAEEVIAVAARGLEAIAAFGYVPVVVIDDSDAFTRGRTDEERRELVGAFFGRALSALTKLDCGLIVAVHSDYADLGEYQRARTEFGVLQRVIEVPEIPSGHVRRILARRVSLAADTHLDEVLTESAVDQLAAINRGAAARNLRMVLAVAHEALAAAVDSDADVIDDLDVAAAATKHLP
jgi:type II secretory pathway predicted ATPase ExeA